MDSYSVTQHVAQSTHVSGHILDWVITSATDKIVHSVLVSSLISDHNAVHATLETAKPLLPITEIAYRKIKQIDPEAFVNDIKKSALIKSPATTLDGLIN